MAKSSLKLVVFIMLISYKDGTVCCTMVQMHG